MNIGIALGAGGARGLAHIVALEALDDLGLKPTLIAGSSMGAIIGACHAAGIPARDLRRHAVELFSDRGKVMATLLQARVGKLADLFARMPGNPALIDGEALLDLLWPDMVPDRFEDLALPFRAVATDFFARRLRIFSEGALVTGVAASMAIPGLVRPVIAGGTAYVDGAVVNPLPFDILEDCDFTIGVDVTGGPRTHQTILPEPFEALLGASQIMMGEIVREKLKAQRPDLVLSPAVQSFAALDFFRVTEILEAAAPMADDLKRDVEAAFSALR